MKKYKYNFLDPKLPLKKRVSDLLSRLTLSEKIGLIPANQKPIPRLGIAALRFGTEIARGYISRNHDEFSTVFPQPIALASTFSPELMLELGEIAGTETAIYNKRLDESRLMVWGPTVDLCRDPRWGRNEEGYGEDPLLTGEMSKAYTRGMRGEHKKYLRVLSGLKHFCCNNHEEDRTKDSANVDLRILNEYYYSAFEPAIRSKGAHSLMTAYNELSGLPAMINPDLKKVCKKQWGMLFAVTDGGDFSQNVNVHNFASSHGETVAAAIKAGNSIMTDNDSDMIIAATKEALNNRLITEDDLDKAILPVLEGRFMLGEFDPPELNPYNNIPDELLCCEKFKSVSRRASLECVTLLKNDDNLLPIKDNGEMKIAIVGLLSDNYYKDWYTGMSPEVTTILSEFTSRLGESRILHHDGCDIVALRASNSKYVRVNSSGEVVADSDDISDECLFKKIDHNGKIVYKSEYNKKHLRTSEIPFKVIEPDEPIGIVNADGEDTFEWFSRMAFETTEYEGKITLKSWRGKLISLSKGECYLCEVEGGVNNNTLFEEVLVKDAIESATIICEKSDYAIVCLGNDPMLPARECFDRKTLSLPKPQKQLLESVIKANKNTVLVITSSYPYSIDNVEQIPSIVYTGHGGPFGGEAMTDILLGEYNPAGRTPQTWYKSERDLPDIKDYDIISSNSTYLYFEGDVLFPFGYGLSYSSFEYSDFKVRDAGSNIEVSLNVTNTSDIFGEEVIQIYFTPLSPRVKRPIKQLCEFTKQGILAHKTIELTLSFEKERLRFWDVTRNKFAVETLGYKFYAGASSRDIRCESVILVKGEKIPTRTFSKTTPIINYDDKRDIYLYYDKERERHYISPVKSLTTFSGMVEFYDVSLKNARSIELTMSTSAGEGKASIYFDGELIGEIVVPARACPTDFKKQRCNIISTGKELDTGRLSISITQNVALLDIRVLS